MTIKEISHESFYNMQKYSQIVIDLIEEVEQDYEQLDREEGSKFIPGAYQYDIENLLEIINPKLKDDIQLLKELNNWLEFPPKKEE